MSCINNSIYMYDVLTISYYLFSFNLEKLTTINTSEICFYVHVYNVMNILNKNLLIFRRNYHTFKGAPVTRPGSQTQSLSPDLIKRCADDFKSKYRTTFCKIRADPLDPDSIVPFTDMYTNLVLEEEYRKKRKRPLEYSDLFKLEVNGEFPKRIMVQGEAGAGKTTFCAKIAWDWINDSPALPKFVWVLVVPFREAKQYTIGEIAKSYLSKGNPATACQITEYIRSNPTHVFIAFDGLDEFKGKVVQEGEAGSKSECHQPKSADQTKARSESKMNKKSSKSNAAKVIKCHFAAKSQQCRGKWKFFRER